METLSLCVQVAWKVRIMLVETFRRLSYVAPYGDWSGSAPHHCWILDETMALQGNNQHNMLDDVKSTSWTMG